MAEEQEKYTEDQLLSELKEDGVPEELHDDYLDVAREKGMLEEKKEEAEEPEEAKETEETPEEPEQEKETPEDGDSQPEEGEKGETEEPEPEKKEPEQEKTVPLAALHEERRKRQERDRQLQQMQQQIQQMQQQQQKESEGEKDPLEALIEEKLQKKFEPIQKETERRTQAEAFNTYVEQRETEAKAKHPDYDDVTSPVLEYAQQQAQSGDTSTLQMIFNSPNPAEMAYVIGSAYKYQNMVKSQKEAEERRRKEESDRKKQKVNAMDSLPRGDDVVGGTPAKGAVLRMSEYESWPERAKRDLLDGRKPSGYTVEA